MSDAAAPETASDLGLNGAYEHIRVERRANGVVIITLDWPERRNAMSGPMTASWVRAVDTLRGDRDLRALVVTGAGSAFCSGGDVSWIGSEPDASVDDLRARMLPFYRAWLSVRDLEVPVVAAVNGAAIGAGLALALACDLRYAAEGAKLGVPFTSLGMHPGMATTYLLPQVVGPAIARELLLTGRIVTGAEAATLGLVTRALPTDDVLAHALEVADRIADAAPVATRLTTLALRAGHADIEAALQWEAMAQPITLATADLHEGLRAQQERRAPRFTGR